MWGKSNFYLESVAVPMILSGPGVSTGVNDTPVSLLDVHPTILENFGLSTDSAPLEQEIPRPGRSLLDIARKGDDRERAVFSEYHAAGSPSAGFMLRKGQWKYHHYIGYAPELFDLDSDREELYDLASSPEHSGVLAMMESELRKICDPDIVNQAAKADQAKLIERHGGREKALFVGAPAATPVPGANAKFGD
jgi:choline-sulfatase